MYVHLKIFIEVNPVVVDSLEVNRFGIYTELYSS